MKKPVVSLVTQVLVKRTDPAFANPTKPIGGFMSEAEARIFEAQGWRVVEDAGRGWRRVVASPKPQRIVEKEAIRLLLNTGSIEIAVGGGGIPVLQNRRGELRQLQGVYAVIDKDLASGLLAAELDVDLLLISTGVEKVSLHFNTPQQQDLDHITPEQLAHYIEEGHFAPGSMLPKVQAVLDFVQETGHPALITHPAHIASALRGETGTWIEPASTPVQA
jgi:carbamate kinase